MVIIVDKEENKMNFMPFSVCSGNYFRIFVMQLINPFWFCIKKSFREAIAHIDSIGLCTDSTRYFFVMTYYASRTEIGNRKKKSNAL